MGYDFEIEKNLAAMPGGLGIEYLDGLVNSDGGVNAYYRFLYRLSTIFVPKITVELGVWIGWSTAHLAASATGTIFAIDPEPSPGFKEVTNRYPNIVPILARSDNQAILDLFRDGTVDICFIDTIHEYEQASKEMRLWTPKMRPGGLFLCDDIALNDGMKQFWAEVPFEKVSLPMLHFSGFGMARVPITA